jgi:hypothetical protein
MLLKGCIFMGVSARFRLLLPFGAAKPINRNERWLLPIVGWLALANPGPHTAGKSSPFLPSAVMHIAFVENHHHSYSGNVKNIFLNTCGNVKYD